MRHLPRNRCLSLSLLKPKTRDVPDQILAQVITNQLKSPALVGKLIEQFCSVSETSKARLVFTHFHYPNLFLFNTLIRCNHPRHSLELFANWVSKQVLVLDNITYLYVLGSCSRLPSLSTLWLGRQIQGRMLKHGFVADVILQTTLVDFYARNGDVSSGRKVFDEMAQRNVVTWNAMISGYSSRRRKDNEFARGGLLLFRDMLVDVCGEKPNETTLVCVLSASAQLGVLETGACVHGYIEKTVCAPESNVFVGTGLVDMYAKCGCLDCASNIFVQMTVKNVLTWTAMATGLAIHGRGRETLKLLDEMKTSRAKPNAVTFTSLLSACCRAGLVAEGLHLFSNMRSKFGVEPRMQHYGCIVDLLGRAGHLKEAYEIISEMPIEPDAILWRSLLSASKVHGDVELGEKVGKILLQLQQLHTSPMDSYNACEDYVALSNIYASTERWDDVQILRKEMKVRGIETEPGASLVQAASNSSLTHISC